MKITLSIDEAASDAFLPAQRPDGSGIGINYADAYLKSFRATLDDGRKLLATRRGLRITLSVGEARGEGLLRRLLHGPDPKVLLREALAEAVGQLGGRVCFAAGGAEIELP